MWPASEEWYAPWKSIDGHDVEPNTTGTMKTLVAGLLRRDRILSYLRHFILFEVVGDKITKKGAKYHQFFAVQLAAERAVAVFRNGGQTKASEPLPAAKVAEGPADGYRGGDDKRLGVIWHTTGSGKSLSMVFLVGLLRRHPELRNPTFVIQVDRTDLDDQLHDQFVAAKALVGDVKHAETVDQLRDLLRTEGGEVTGASRRRT
jgi:type I restriction enzyme R subunit